MFLHTFCKIKQYLKDVSTFTVLDEADMDLIAGQIQKSKYILYTRLGIAPYSNVSPKDDGLVFVIVAKACKILNNCLASYIFQSIRMVFYPMHFKI